jgi:hypothetical protein
LSSSSLSLKLSSSLSSSSDESLDGAAESVGKEMPISRIVVAVPNASVVLLD